MRSISAHLFSLLASILVASAQTPVITSVTNYLGDARISPGDSVQVFGTWPADGARNWSVTVGGLPGSVGLSWIIRNTNARELDIAVPPDLPLGMSSVVVSHLGTSSNAFPIMITPFTPVLGFDASTTFQHLSGQYVTPSLPAAPGEIIATFMTGLGATTPSVPIGQVPSTFVYTTTTPVVTLAGKPVQLQFAGYPPGQRSYQVNFTVPSNTGSGPQPIVVSIGDVSSNTQALFVGTQALPAPPTISLAANGANFSTKPDLAPGSFISIFASGLGTVDNLSVFPATTVNGISVSINGKLAPIFHLIASKGQINALVPTDADIGSSLNVVVQNANGPSRSFVLIGAATSPAAFVLADPSDSTRKSAIATLANTAWLVLPASQTQALGLSACTGLSNAVQCGQPARRGDYVQVFVTGLGKTTPNGDPNGVPLPSDQIAPASGSPLYTMIAPLPSVTVGGATANVIFAGLAPGYNGVYQLDFQIPSNSTTGDSVPLQISTLGSVVDITTLAISAQ